MSYHGLGQFLPFKPIEKTPDTIEQPSSGIKPMTVINYNPMLEPAGHEIGDQALIQEMQAKAGALQPTDPSAFQQPMIKVGMPKMPTPVSPQTIAIEPGPVPKMVPIEPGLLTKIPPKQIKDPSTVLTEAQKAFLNRCKKYNGVIDAHGCCHTEHGSWQLVKGLIAPCPHDKPKGSSVAAAQLPATTTPITKPKSTVPTDKQIFEHAVAFFKKKMSGQKPHHDLEEVVNWAMTHGKSNIVEEAEMVAKGGGAPITATMPPTGQPSEPIIEEGAPVTEPMPTHPVTGTSKPTGTIEKFVPETGLFPAQPGGAVDPSVEQQKLEKYCKSVGGMMTKSGCVVGFPGQLITSVPAPMDKAVGPITKQAPPPTGQIPPGTTPTGPIGPKDAYKTKGPIGMQYKQQQQAAAAAAAAAAAKTTKSPVVPIAMAAGAALLLARLLK